MNIEKYEKALINLLNLDGWNLEWCGNENTFYDARGYTPKGYRAVVEIKARNKYYETKMLEKAKYDRLMSLDEDVVKLYFVNDPKGNYLYWLNKIEMPNIDDKACPKTTMWDKTKVSKEVYMLKESQASIINRYQEDEDGVWDDYFKDKCS
jgi:hypothetical protein